MNSDSAGSVQGAQAVARAFALLRAVAKAPPTGIALADLARENELSKPTAHRLLLALIAEGMIEQDPQSARYSIGRECYVFGSIADARFGLRSLASESIVRLAEQTGESAFFSIRSGFHSVCLIREDGDSPLKTNVLQPGARHPLGVGAGSLAMLAALDDQEMEMCLQQNAQLLADSYPNCAPEQLRKLVEDARTQGFAVNRGLVVAGSWGVGIAVRGSAREVLGALSIAAVEPRLSQGRQREIGIMLKREAIIVEARVCNSLAGANSRGK